MSNLAITGLLLLWLIPIGINIWVDRNGDKPNYLMVFVLRAIASIVHMVFFDVRNGLDIIPLFIFQITSFWILFEIGLNLVRDRPFLYFDRTENDSGWIDEIFDFLGTTAHAVAKAAALTACVLAIIAIYERFG
jgi:hypothetical protein